MTLLAHVRREHRLAVGRVDLPALDLELRDLLDRVVLARGEPARGPRLPVGRGDDERAEHHERGERDTGDLAIHAITRWELARWETSSRPASITKFATIDEPPYETNGSVIPVSGISAQDAADDDERLQREGEREPRREQLREAVVDLERDLHPARDDEHEDEQQRRDADQPELLRERGVDEVGVDVRDQLAARRRS